MTQDVTLPTRLPPLKSLQAFEACARLESFKAAAQELCVTPAAVSHQIRTLESMLDMQLFDRDSKGVRLSESGKQFYPQVHDAFQLLQSAVADLKVLSGNRTINLTAGPAFITKWLTPNLGQFKADNPALSLAMDASLAVYDFRKPGFDIAVRFGKNRPVPNVVSHDLVEEAVVPVISPELLAQFNGSFTPEDLLQCEIIHDRSLTMVTDQVPSWKTWCKQVGLSGVDVEGGLFFNHADHAIQAVVEGAGVGLVRVVLAAKDIKAGRLIVPFGPILPCGLSFSTLVREDAIEDEAILKLTNWITALIKKDMQALESKIDDPALPGLIRC